jgi:hypothetical protein
MAEQQEELVLGGSQTAKLDRLIEDLRDIASSQPTSPFSSPVSFDSPKNFISNLMGAPKKIFKNNMSEFSSGILFL